MKSSLIPAIILGISLVSAGSAAVVTSTPHNEMPHVTGTTTGPDTSMSFGPSAQQQSRFVPPASPGGSMTSGAYCGGTNVAATPEPASMALLGSGLIGLAMWSARRRRGQNEG